MRSKFSLSLGTEQRSLQNFDTILPKHPFSITHAIRKFNFHQKLSHFLFTAKARCSSRSVDGSSRPAAPPRPCNASSRCFAWPSTSPATLKSKICSTHVKTTRSQSSRSHRIEASKRRSHFSINSSTMVVPTVWAQSIVTAGISTRWIDVRWSRRCCPILAFRVTKCSIRRQIRIRPSKCSWRIWTRKSWKSSPSESRWMRKMRQEWV